MSQKSTILIVDDEPVGRRLLEVLLSNQGYHLVTAGSGSEALRQAALLMPDLILLDIMMQDMNGFEVCQRLRDDPLLAEVPIIMVTALDDRESRLRGIEVGADDFITKPVDRAELRKRVQTIIRLDRYRLLLKERDQRQQAEEEMRRRNRELTLLNNVITAAASTLNVYEMVFIACEALSRSFEMPRALALLLDEEQRQAKIVAQYNSPAVAQTADQEHMPVWQPAPCHILEQVFAVELIPALVALVEQKRPLAFYAAQATSQLASLHAKVPRDEMAALLMVPILARDPERVAGCILLNTSKQRLFKADDFALAQGVATAVGQAMETAQLYERLQRYADQLEETVHQRTLELQIERDRTQAILEALGEAVIVTDKDGTIQYVNPAATELTGYSPSEVLGKNWGVWQNDDQPSEWYTQIQLYVQAGKTWRGEVVQKRKDDTLYDAAMIVAPIFDPHVPGSLIGIVSVQRDVTPLKEAERLKDQFVSNVSHELRTPLSIITLLTGNLDTLFDRLDEKKRQKMIRDVREHTKVLNDLVNSVLEISRIDSRRISRQYQGVDLVALLCEEVESQLPLAQKKEQLLEVRGIEQLSVWGNDGQLRQVIRNLLNNAIKYTPPQGHIWCECQERRTGEQEMTDQQLSDIPTLEPWPGSAALPAGRWAALRVVDTGVGISPEELPHIFERFYRVQAQGSIPGTGLGLSIAQELIHLHEGQIAIASVPRQGSVVAFYLPLVEETLL